MKDLNNSHLNILPGRDFNYYLNPELHVLLLNVQRNSNLTYLRTIQSEMFISKFYRYK